MTVKLKTEHHLEFLSLKGGCTGSSESSHVKMPHCWKSHVVAQADVHDVMRRLMLVCAICLCPTKRTQGAQWLSGRVLDSRPKGRGFEPHRRHCVVVLEQDTFILA